MRKANLNALRPLLLSLVLMATTPLASIKAQPPASAVQSSKDNRMVKLESKVAELTKNHEESGKAGLLGVSWPLLLAGGSSLLSMIALLMATGASLSRRKQHEEILRLNEEIKKLKGNNQSLLLRIGGVEAQMEQGVMNWSRAIATSSQKPASAQVQPSKSMSWPVPVPVVDTKPAPAPIPVPAPVPTPGPPAVTRTSLINSLNAGDRQQLREVASAELNITSESENALAMGRAIATELEEVPGGGSYWLVSLQGEHLLFPTDRTIKGFAAAQPAKGIFNFEQQTIAHPQLMEPALLENQGTRWCIKTMGRIAVP
jgi:hypothetical protein